MENWISGSIGYHGDDGYLFTGDGNGKKYGKPFGNTTTSDDIIYCYLRITF